MTFRPIIVLTIVSITCGMSPASAQTKTTVTRSMAQYRLDDIELVRDDGKVVALAAELNDSRPVIVNFIFTNCPGICPLSSQIFSQVQRQTGDKNSSVHLVSISIDPENDTPAKLRAYAHQFGAGRAWNHYTGSLASIVATEKAFRVYGRDKMEHAPVTFVRRASESDWIRLDGFATADVLIREIGPQSSASTPLTGR